MFTSGQSFRWQQHNTQYVGVLGENVVALAYGDEIDGPDSNVPEVRSTPMYWFVVLYGESDQHADGTNRFSISTN